MAETSRFVGSDSVALTCKRILWPSIREIVTRMAVRLVVLDMAGTTVHDPDGVGRCLKAALTNDCVTWSDGSVNAVMGVPKPLAIAAIVERSGEVPEQARIERIHRDFQRRMTEYYRSDPDVREVEGATELFRNLREKGVKVVLDTGFDRSIVDVLLPRLGWADGIVDATVTSDEVRHGRPHPDMIYRAMELTVVADPAEVAKVGDTPSDLAEGTAAGCGWVVGITSGTHSEAQLRPHPHSHLIGSLAELPAVLGL